jgi:hypothetical protein
MHLAHGARLGAIATAVRLVDDNRATACNSAIQKDFKLSVAHFDLYFYNNSALPARQSRQSASTHANHE